LSIYAFESIRGAELSVESHLSALECKSCTRS